MGVQVRASYSSAPTAEKPGILGVQILSDSPITRPIHIGLVLDTSGSMEGERLSAVKKTLTVLIDKLQDADIISVVGFSVTAEIILKTLQITSENRAAALEQIGKLVAEGGTNMEAGVTALGCMYKNSTNLPNAIVLLTDGQINQGIATSAGLASLLKSYLPLIPVYTLGYGEDHNSDLLRSLSARTQATYTYINNEIVLPSSIGDLLGGLQNEVAKTASILFPESYKCLENFVNEVPTTYHIGSLIAEKPTWVVFEVPFGASGWLQLNYTLTGTVGLEVVTKEIVIDESLDKLDVVEQLLRCKTAAALNEVSILLAANSIAAAKQTLTVALNILKISEACDRPLVIRMKAQLEEMVEEVGKYVNSPPNYMRGGQQNTAAMVFQTSSTAANYSAQRGITGGADRLFSSPRQIQRAVEMVTQYSQQTPEDPAHTA
jgi:hypothetical protein